MCPLEFHVYYYYFCLHNWTRNQRARFLTSLSENMPVTEKLCWFVLLFWVFIEPSSKVKYVDVGGERPPCLMGIELLSAFTAGLCLAAGGVLVECVFVSLCMLICASGSYRSFLLLCELNTLREKCYCNIYSTSNVRRRPGCFLVFDSLCVSSPW